MNAILFQSANVLDVASLQLKTGQDVWVENGMIKSVGPHQADVFIASGTKVIKAEGKTLMPGMIDCHVHVIAAHLNLNITANHPNVFATLRALPIMKGMLLALIPILPCRRPYPCRYLHFQYHYKQQQRNTKI